ncbi:phospholipase A and acyltransferase 1-like [Polyodon spathula]|uniref:phospholipase A and acyltransferase 1-like n=1 Tax=Polyodon spathula TaxID=7913 RepID=UPI001B7EC759|nr:phospholipase A and acyltransferase 1-like [Polyodon spathula]
MVVHFTKKTTFKVMKDELMAVANNALCWLDNDLDKTNSVQPIDNMKKTVNILLGNGCGRYNLLKNNCQHVASFVRYGKAISPQVEKIISQKFVKPKLGKRKRRKRMIGSY